MSEEISAAARDRLGRHRSTYLPSFAGAGAISGFLAVSAGSGVVAVIGIGTGIRGVFWLGAVVAVLSGLAGLLSMSDNRKAAGLRLELFEHGLVTVSKSGLVLAFRWDSTTVYQSIVRRTINGAASTHHAYTLYGPGSAMVKLLGDEIPKAETWGPAIQNAVTEAQLPETLAALQRGETLTFGDIALTAGGVVANGKARTWREVQKIDVRNGHVSIKAEGKWLALSNTAVSRIPNFFVFITVAEYLRSQAVESTDFWH